MNRERSVVEYYVLCNKLKDVVRTGWKDWKVERERVESIAEHIYGVQMLAIAMWSEYEYAIDLKKVLAMLAVHELEETIIGDLTQFQISKQEKEEMGHKAIRQILSKLVGGDEIESLILEFDKRETPEALFSYQCDKLECDIQCKIYDEEGRVNLHNQSDNSTAQDDVVSELLASGMSWSEMWLTFGQTKYPYDENFSAVSNYVMNNKITNNQDKEL